MSATDILHQRKAGFKEDDKVNMRVSKRVMIDGTEVTRVEFDAFTVSERRYHQSRWQYKLKDRKGLLYSEGENWFSENKLKPT